MRECAFFSGVQEGRPKAGVTVSFKEDRQVPEGVEMCK